ncbi:MAG: hypothetical protein GY940_02520, partial [bacterium]|nr:hypothetical protein [bacterium]
MRASKFLKDFFSTGFSQAGVLIFSLVLLKLMADAFSESHFGLFNLVRRWNLILIPVITLNLSIGLVRYVSYEKEKSSFFLHLSLVTSAALCLPVFSALILFPSVFSKLLFDTPGHGRLVMALALFLTANIMHLMAYSYLRGKLEMNAANLLRTLFFGVPLLPAAAILLFKKETAFAPVSHLYLFFLAYAVWGIFISGYYLGKEFSGSAVTSIFRKGRSSVSDALKQGRDIFRFSLSRIPAVFFIAMVFGFPVLYAGYRLSLKAAGYVGIVVSILRLFEIFSMPFNMIFLPKFSALKRGNDPQLIRDHCRVVVDFIFTFLPFCGVFIFGLLHFAVRAWFPPSYLAAVDSIAVTVLFSAFYLAYALVRGILDGLFEFPYTNIICFSGFSIIALTALVFGST